MADTAAGATLTAAYKQTQTAESAKLLLELQALWVLLDPRQIDASFKRYVPAASAVVRNASLTVGARAAEYYRQFRLAEGVPGAAPQPDMTPIDDQQLAVSLLVTGPVAFKRAIGAGQAPEQALETAFFWQSGAASRIALDTGRDAIVRSTQVDDKAHGFARVTSGRACAFCAMLASRGPVYKTEETAGTVHRYHDHCHCSVEPFFSEDPKWQKQSAQYGALWAQSTSGLSGQDALNAFRAALSG